MARLSTTASTGTFVLVCLSFLTADADDFLKHSHDGNRFVSLEARSEELQAALGAVLGCTADEASGDQLARTARVRESLAPVWKTLPKNSDGRVEWKLVRYMAHRHFMSFGVLVRGLEPSIQVNSSNAGEAAVLNHQAPGLAKQISASPSEHGFSLEDSAVMVAALEQLLFDSDRVVLEKIYKNRGHAATALLTKEQMQALMKDYMVHWMLGEDQEGAAMLLQDPKLLAESIPHWDAIIAMVEGSVTALDYSRLQTPRRGSARTFESQHSFEDALEVAGSIGRNFAYFWEAQCQDIKSSLVAFDSSSTGRVRLADFYGANKEGEWRFGESEEYLRELGALDESSSWKGKQVVVPNYMQAVSNCIVTRPHYLVCCLNECEEVLGQVETAIGAPVAAADDLLRIVNDLTNADDESAKIDSAMRSQLHRIANMHGGKVPLHGRLFAQWLHYVFPRECPFPHKTGTAAARTPLQFGDNFAVSQDEVNKQVADEIVKKDLQPGGVNSSGEEMQWMSQWSEEEELLVEYSSQISAPWNRTKVLLAGGAVAAMLGLLSWAGVSGSKSTPAVYQTSHFV